MVQDNLNNAYENFQARLRGIDECTLDSFSPPLLIGVTNEWANAEHRVLWVGQETAGWNWEGDFLETGNFGKCYPSLKSLNDFVRYNSSIEALVYAYNEFAFAENHPAKKNPFWRYFRWTAGELGKSATTSMLWSNIIRCSADSERGYTLWSVAEATRTKLLTCQLGLLSEEIRILNPTIFFFMSGPYYDNFIKDEFVGCEFEPLSSFEARKAAQIKHDRLPKFCFRTYHPGYLNRCELGFNPIQASVDLIS